MTANGPVSDEVKRLRQMAQDRRAVCFVLFCRSRRAQAADLASQQHGTAAADPRRDAAPCEAPS